MHYNVAGFNLEGELRQYMTKQGLPLPLLSRAVTCAAVLIPVVGFEGPHRKCLSFKMVFDPENS